MTRPKLNQEDINTIYTIQLNKTEMALILYGLELIKNNDDINEPLGENIECVYSAHRKVRATVWG